MNTSLGAFSDFYMRKSYGFATATCSHGLQGPSMSGQEFVLFIKKKFSPLSAMPMTAYVFFDKLQSCLKFICNINYVLP